MKMYISLDKHVEEALKELAMEEVRPIKWQAELLIAEGLRRRRFLDVDMQKKHSNYSNDIDVDTEEPDAITVGGLIQILKPLNPDAGVLIEAWSTETKDDGLFALHRFRVENDGMRLILEQDDLYRLAEEEALRGD